MQEKESVMVFGVDRKIHPSGSLRKASGCQTVTHGRFSLSAPHTHERFLYSRFHIKLEFVHDCDWSGT